MPYRKTDPSQICCSQYAVMIPKQTPNSQETANLLQLLPKERRNTRGNKAAFSQDCINTAQCKMCSKNTAVQENLTKLRNCLPDPNWCEVNTNVCSDLKALRSKPSMYGFCWTYLKIYDLCNEEKAKKDLLGHQVQSHIISDISSHAVFPYWINLYL